MIRECHLGTLFLSNVNSSNKTIEQIFQVTDDLLKELMINRKQICGIGVSAVGPLDREKGILLNPINFEGENWNNLPIKYKLHFK